MTATPSFFETAGQFRAWLGKHHASATELLVGFRKVGTGQQSIGWSEAVDEALCFGWIDGARKRIDENSYQIRFTPWKPGSIRSHVNVAKVQALLAAGRMRPPGIRAFEARTEGKTGVYAFERRSPAELGEGELKLFRKHKLAWSYFNQCPPSYRNVMLHWITGAKQVATRERRLNQLITACAEQRRIK